MIYRDIEYSLMRSTMPDRWTWQFRIGERIRRGTTEAKLELLAARRVQQRIDRELKRLSRDAGA